MLRTKLKGSLSVITLLILTFATSAHVNAQASDASRTRPRQATPAPSQSRAQAASPSSAASTENADLSITAHVSARELRFEKVPNTSVEFTGKPLRDTLWEAERENLPAQVRPGETYRNIGITLRITSVFADIERIVAEALGEIPVSDDDARPQQREGQTQSPAQPPSPQSTPPEREVDLDSQTAPASPPPTTQRRTRGETGETQDARSTSPSQTFPPATSTTDGAKATRKSAPRKREGSETHTF
ncbi:MAG: hypothetical protein WCD76_05335 [Pyrinomonadaceae bacterium]